ncbi:DNA topoisomerase 3 [Geobacillus sp. BCO2]|nr:DNA topoisomerase 3 [Geobacillus sp. BCO2]
MKVIIAEKPDQGATLASIFPHQKRQGYIEIKPNDLFPDGAYMTWAIGHLFQLAPPERYRPEWKRWTLEALPIIPERFEYEIEKAKAKTVQGCERTAAKAGSDGNHPCRRRGARRGAHCAQPHPPKRREQADEAALAVVLDPEGDRGRVLPFA